MLSARHCSTHKWLDIDPLEPLNKPLRSGNSHSSFESSLENYVNDGIFYGEAIQPDSGLHEVPQIDLPWIEDSIAHKWAWMSWALTDALQCNLYPIWKDVDGVAIRSAVSNSESSFSKTSSLTSANRASATGGMTRRLETSRSIFFGGTATRCKPLHPTGKLRLSWDSCGLVLCLFELVFLPMLLTNLIEPNVHFAIVNCFYWTLDVGVAFMTGYFTDYGLLEVRFKMIAEKYLKTWFLVDTLLALLDWCILILGEAWAFGKVMKSAARFVRVARLLRILRLASKMQDQLGRVTSQVAFTFLRLLSYMLVVLLLNHYIASFWCAFWNYGGDNNGDFSSDKYALALHWSLSHCFLSSMDVYPTNFEERTFTCVVLIVSLAICSIILSMITNDALALRSVSADRNAKNLILMSFFSEHRLPTELTCRVWRFVLQHKLFDGTAQQHEKSKEALQLLPAHVQQEIREEWFSPVLRSHPLFDAYFDMEPLAARLLCNSGIEVLTLLPDEQLLWPMQRLEQMVFVEKGQLLYYPEGDPNAIVVGPCMWACEEALWSSSASLPGRMVAALSTCTLLLLGFKEFKDAVHHYRKSLRFIRRYAAAFAKEFNKACEDFKPHEVLFNDSERIVSLLGEANAPDDNVVTRVLSSIKKDSVRLTEDLVNFRSEESF